MRLLVVTNDFPPTVGGIENYIYSLTRRWPAHELVVVTRAVPGGEHFDSGLDFEVIREPADTLLPVPSMARRVLGLVTERRIDIVHFPSALPLALLGPGLGIPYAVSVHGGEFRLASRIPGVRSALKGVCREAAVILPQSSFAETLVVSLMGRQVPMCRVTCGVDADRYGPGVAQPVELSGGGPLVVSVSRLVPRKGPRTLVQAFPRVIREHPDARLLIVGGGPDRELLERRVSSGDLGSSVTIAGSQPWERIPSYLAAGDIFALPTRARFFGTETEGLPLVYVEAAAAALPLIGADVGGVRDAVRPGETGILVDGSSPQQTADAILTLIGDPALARRLGAAGREMALREFSWDAIFQEYWSALRRAVESAGGLSGEVS